MEEMCSLDQVIDKSYILCMNDEFRDNTDPFCHYVDDYKIAEYDYEVGKVIKSAPAYWKTASFRDLKAAEKEVKREITDIVCSEAGKNFVAVLNLVENIPCKNVVDSCQRFRTELNLL